MFDLGPTAWILVLLAAFIVGFAKTGIAGIGTLAPLLMVEAFPHDAGPSTGILLPMLIVGDLFTIAYYRRHAEWRHVFRALPWGFAGIVGGFIFVYMLQQEDQTVVNLYLRRLIGGIVVFILIFSFWLNRRKASKDSSIPWWLAPFLGLLGGFTTMVANAAGPIFLAYLLALDLPKKTFLGTMGCLFLILNASKLPFSYGLGFITADSLVFNLKMLPAIAVGAVIGAMVVKHIPQKVFTIAVRILTAIAAIKLLFT